MRTTKEINARLMEIGSDLADLDTRRAELEREQRTLWAERDAAQSVEEFVRAPAEDRAAFETKVQADSEAAAALIDDAKG